MDFISKLKETLTSVLPVILIVLILHFTLVPLENLLLPFIVGSIMLPLGLSLFLGGTDIGMIPIGEKLGVVLTNKKNIILILLIGFIIGFSVTFAEPDVSVLVARINSMNPNLNEIFLKLMIALGLGLFLALGLFRAYKHIELKYIMLLGYMGVFIFIAFITQNEIAISFDSSGATTGPLAVPFILSLGLGVSSSVKGNNEDSFGLTGVASMGPIIVLSFMFLISADSNSANAVSETAQESILFIPTLISVLKKTFIGFAPLAIIIIALQFLLFKFPKIKFRKILFGIVYSFIGMVIFLTGVEFGFSRVGFKLGHVLITKYKIYVPILIALLFGTLSVLAEPAVWILVNQVEEVTDGRIKRATIMIFLCIGVSIAVVLSILRIIFSLNYIWFIYVTVGISLIFSFISPPLFSGLAFDSGGTVSGPMSTSFLMSFILGTSTAESSGFGMIGLVALSPFITIQILGIIYKIKEKKIKKEVLSE